MQNTTKKKIWHSTRLSLFALISIIMLSFVFPALAGAVSVTVDPLTTNDDTPTLTGTVSTDAINVNIRIGTENHNAAISGSGTTWLIGWPASLSDGTYDVHATAMDGEYNFGYDSTTDELVIDITAPVITLTGANPQVIQVGDIYTELGATVTDNYDTGLSASIDSSTVDTAIVGDYFVTYDAQDSNGNHATQLIRTVSVVDTEAPVITLTGANPQVIQVGDTYTELGATVTDNYDTGLSATINSSSVNTAVVGDYSVTYDAQDSNGNHATQLIRTVSVVDTEAPVITLTGANPQVIQVGDTYTELGATVTDNYDTGLSASIDSSTVDTAIVGDYFVTYDAQDSNSNHATQLTRTVSVVDTEAPVITLTGANPQVIQVGDTYTELGATVTDNYDTGLSASIDSSTVDTAIVGDYFVTYDAQDSNSNHATQLTRTVSVVDTEAPVITLTGANPQVIQVGDTYTELGATVTDNYDTGLSATINSSSVNTAVVGDYSVTYDAQDSNSNHATQLTRTVSVVDTEAPVITLTGANPQVIQVGDTYTELGATVTDNYDTGLSASIDSSTVDTAIVGDYSVTYDAQDSNGNHATQLTRTVSVVDTEAPVITLTGANPQVIQVGDTYTELGATVTDNYDTGLSASIDSSTVDTAIVGDYFVTYDAQDSNGNHATQLIRTVSVVDTEAPVITLTGANPQVIQVGDIYTELGATVTDNYDTGLSASIDSSTVDTAIVGDYFVTYDAQDSNGNHATQLTRTVSVVDTEAPVITLTGANPQVIQVGDTYTELGATVTDNYDTGLSASIDSSTVDTATVGDYFVTYDAQDSNSNHATQLTRTVSVVDTEAPVITLTGANPQVIQVGDTYTELGATVTDNYDTGLSATINSSSVNTAVVGDYSVTYDAQDSNNNHATQLIRTVSVVDTEAPVITLTGANPQVIQVGDIYTELGATVTDNYDTGLSATINSSSVNTAVVGDYSVTYDAQDSDGNNATQVIRTVSVVDTTAPIITLTGDNPQILHLSDTYNELGATAEDNYDGDITESIVIDSDAVNTAVLGDYTVFYDVTDSQDNEAIQATRIVSVVNQLPIANDDSFTIFENDSIENGDVTTAGTADFLGDEPATITVVDQSNVTHGTLTWHAANDGTFDYDPDPLSSGQVIDTFTYRIEDANGDTDIATATITITDVPLFPNPIPDIFYMNEDDYLGEEDGDLGALIGDVKLARTPYDVPDGLGDLPAQVLLDTDPATPGAQEPEDNDPDAPGLQTTLLNGALDWYVDGTFAYTPDSNFYTESAPEQFHYLIIDANGDTSSSVAVHIYVDPVNDDPIAVNDTFEMDEDSGSLAEDVSANDYLHDEPVIFTRILDVTKGDLVLNGHNPVDDTFDGTFSYTPDLDEDSDDSFTYTITDKDGQTTAPATVTINILQTNDAPVAQDDNITNIDEDSLNNELDVLTANGYGPDSDLDGDDLTIRDAGSGGRADHGDISIRLDGKRVIYTPDDDYYGQDSFGYEICDSGQDGIAGNDDDQCDNATVTLTINNVNDAPTAVGEEHYYMYEDSILTINPPGVLDDDYDLKDPDDTLVAELVLPPSNAISFNLNPDGSFGYWPQANFYGTVSFTYRAVDNGTPPLSSETVTVYITVDPINDSPETFNYTFSVFENAANGAEVGTVVATDAENDALAYSISSGDPNGVFTIDNTNGAITVADAAQLDAETTPQYSLEVTASETETAELYSTDPPSNVTINVTDVNEPPVAGDESADTVQNNPIDINVLLNVTDPDDNIDPDSVEITSDVTHGSTSVVNGVVTYVPETDWCGDDSFEYSVCDTGNLCDTATVNITVRPDNTAPSFSSVPNTDASVGIDYYYRVFIDDPDVDDTLTITANSLPAWLTFNPGNVRQAYVHGTPSSADIGDHYVELEVTDSFGETDTQSFTINVFDVGILSHSNWTVTCDSQETIGEDGDCDNAIDGINSTYWVTQWWDGSPDHPHYIEINLGDVYSLTEFWYLSRQDSRNGRIADYEFYVSLDGTDWDILVPVATGIFPNTTALQKVPLASTTGQFIRLVSLSNVTGREWAAVAELDFIGALSVASETNEAPNGVITAPATTQTIMVDDSVAFAGTASDNDGDLMDCVWNFGDPSIPDETGFSPGSIIFPNPGTYTVTMTVTDGLGVADQTPDTRTIVVESDSNWLETLFDKTGWTATCDSQETIGEDGACINAIDGDLSTYWVTQWTGGSPGPPHELKVDLGAVYDIEGFRYSPRIYQWEGHENGRIKDYNFYVSLDGVNWVSVKSGTFADTDTPQEIIFSKTRGQFVKLEAVTEINDNPWTCVAELDVLAEFIGASNPAPEATIDMPTDQQTTKYVGESVFFAGVGYDDDEDIVAYQWDFNDPYMIFDPQNDPRTLAVPGSIQFNTPGSFTVTFTVQDESGLWDPTPDTRVVNVISDSTWLGHAGWSLWMVDSEETIGEDGAATNAFDETTTSYWVTQWTGGSTPPPHEIQIDLGASYLLEGFRCVPRQDGSTNGNIKKYAFYISSDGSTWGTAVAAGTFDSTSTAKEVLFNGVEGQYIRLVATSEINGNPWTCVSDLDMFGKFVGDGNMPPVATIDQPVGETTILVRSSVSFQGSGTDPDEGDFIDGYLWSFSGPAAIADSTMQNPEVIFNVPGDYTVSFTVYDSAGLPDPTPDTCVIHVESNFSPISQADWLLASVDSEETVGEDGRAIRAFDGDPDTYWVTQWTGGSPDHPHEIVIDLGTFYDVDGLSYLPRQDFNSHGEPVFNGNVLDYEIYISLDGSDWGTYVASGTFDTTRLSKEVNFIIPQRARFIRFVAQSEINDNPWTNAAEINVSGSLPQSSMVLTPETATVVTGGSVSFTVTDGEPDYMFTIIDNQSGGTIDQDGNYTAGITGNAVDTIRVTDALFSVKEAVVTVNENIKIWPQTKNVAVKGKVDFDATGGVPGYIFTIIDDQSGGSIVDSATGLYQAGPVSGGTDTIQVIDSSGNTDVATVSVLDMPVAISPTGISLPVGGQIYFTASGGTPDYTFSIAANLSGGTIDPVTGLYQAGTTFGVNDIIQVVDSQGGDSQTFVSVIEGAQYLNKGSWAIHYVSSEEVNGEYAPAEYAIDDDVDTYWATQWQDGVAQHPHEIQINLGDIYELDGFQYIPNVNSGQIEFYEFYVSLDGINWGDPVVSSCFGYKIDQENVFFPRTVGQYVKFVSFSSENNVDWVSIAEINLMGSPFSNNYAPQVSIDQPLGNTVLTAGESVIFAGTGTMVDGPAPLTVHWDFGDPAIADSSLEDPGEIFYHNPGTYTVIFSVSDDLGQTSQDTRVVKVLDQSAEILVPQERISVLYVDSEELTGENTPASNVLDGNSATNWVTEWSIDPNPTTPHLFILDLGGAYLIDGFQYLPRQDWNRGRVADYNFYVSIDGKNWGSAVATGTLPDVAAEQQILFAPKWGRYVRFVALSEVNGDPWTVVAEFNVEGKCDLPYIKIIEPLAGEIEQITDFAVSASVCLNSSSHTGWGVKFRVDGNQEQTIVLPVDGVIRPETFKVTFTGIAPGLHSVEAFIIDEQGQEVPYENTYDVINNIIVGESYVAIGDSLTFGLFDDFPGDDVSEDGRNSGGGFEPVLNDLLTNEREGTPHTVVNEGFSGEKTEEGLRRLPKVLLENSQAGYFLILYGANDQLNDLSSGLGTDPDAEDYPPNYKSYLQQMINMITSAGKKAYLAKNLYKHDMPDQNFGYEEYNKVIDELVEENNISVTPPPFFEYFKHHPEEQQANNIHPNGIGYQAMANLWRNALMGYNNNPVAVDNLSEIVNQDTVENIIDVLANDYDYDLDTLTITEVSETTVYGGTATIDDNGTPLDPTDDVILYTPCSDYSGVDSFTYTIYDGQGGEATATVEVFVNAPPTAEDDDFPTIEQDSADNIFAVLSNDSDDNDDLLTITAVSYPANGTATIDDNGTPLDPTDDVILYTPSPGYIGDDSFTYDISDGNGGTATGTVTITVI